MGTTTVSVTGVLLAAGAGRRMGRPKALVGDWLRHSVATLLDGGCAGVVVVLGAGADEAEGRLGTPDPRVVITRAPDYTAGMGASLRHGLERLRLGPEEVEEPDAVLVHLVDLPDVDAAVVRRVLGLAGPPDVLARATYGDREAPVPGHPVLIGRAHLDGVRASAAGETGARRYLAAHPVRGVWCGDLASGRDVDHPPAPDQPAPGEPPTGSVGADP